MNIKDRIAGSCNEDVDTFTSKIKDVLDTIPAYKEYVNGGCGYDIIKEFNETFNTCFKGIKRHSIVMNSNKAKRVIKDYDKYVTHVTDWYEKSVVTGPNKPLASEKRCIPIVGPNNTCAYISYDPNATSSRRRNRYSYSSSPKVRNPPAHVLQDNNAFKMLSTAHVNIITDGNRRSLIKDFIAFRRNLIKMHTNNILSTSEGKVESKSLPAGIESCLRKYELSLSSRNGEDDASESIHFRYVEDTSAFNYIIGFRETDYMYGYDRSCRDLKILVAEMDKNVNAHESKHALGFYKNYSSVANNYSSYDDLRGAALESPNYYFTIKDGKDNYSSDQMQINLSGGKDGGLNIRGALVVDDDKVLNIIKKNAKAIDDYYRFWVGAYKTMEFLKKKYAYMRFMNGTF